MFLNLRKESVLNVLKFKKRVLFIDLMNTRFDLMCQALYTDNDCRDMPGLACSSCGHCVTFGGVDNFEERLFTASDVCICLSYVDHFRFLFNNAEDFAEG